MRKSTEILLEKYRLQHEFFKPLEPTIRLVIDSLKSAFDKKRKLLICGNGGSNADADHIVGELVKSFRLKRSLDDSLVDALSNEDLKKKLQGGLPAINLGAQTSLITAMINDVGGDYIFAQQVVAYGRPGDIFLGISTSGNSKNVLLAGETAKALGMKTIGLLGRDGGEMNNLFDLPIVVDSCLTEDIQDLHSTIFHIICAALECEFWGE